MGILEVIDFFGWKYGWSKAQTLELTQDEVNGLAYMIRKREPKT